jgi:hypothetical protein
VFNAIIGQPLIFCDSSVSPVFNTNIGQTLILLRFNRLARVQYHYWSEFMKKQAWRRVCCCSLYKKTRTLSLLSDAGKLVGCSF